jgi:hypothetical protein
MDITVMLVMPAVSYGAGYGWFPVTTIICCRQGQDAEPSLMVPPE